MAGPRWVAVGAGAVPVLEVGEPTGRPVVVLPGLTDGLAPVTDPATQELMGRVPLPMVGFRGLVLSHRMPLPDEPTTRSLAEDVASVLEQLLAVPAVVVGHSMGAMVALHLAARRPDLVAGLALSAGVARAHPALRTVVLRWAALARAGRAGDLALDAVGVSFTGEERRRRQAIARAHPPAPVGVEQAARFAALAAACASHDVGDQLASVTAPALLLHGGLDRLAPPACGRELADRLPAAELTVFEELAHGFPEQAPERYRDRALAFLDRIGWTPLGAGSPPGGNGP